MTRKLLLVLAVLALLGASGAVQATATPKPVAKPSKHTTTYTAKQQFRTHGGKLVTGIRTGTGRVFTGVDTVTETIDPTPTLMQPDAASALAWKKVGYVEDQATWTGATDGYNYILALAADVGWQQVDKGSGPYYSDFGPFQYRQNPGCYRQLKTGGGTLGTSCDFMWYQSALEFKNCSPASQCTLQNFGWRDFYQPSTVSILFAGAWHTITTPDNIQWYGSLQSFTQDAQAHFIKPNHPTRIYCTGSFWYEPYNNTQASDYCTGLTAIN